MLQIYGQSTPHSDIYITGTRESLIRLRQAVDRALSTPSGHGRTEDFPSDGEYFHTYVFVANEAVIKGLASHYGDSDFASIPGRKDVVSTFYNEIRSYLPAEAKR